MYPHYPHHLLHDTLLLISHLLDFVILVPFGSNDLAYGSNIIFITLLVVCYFLIITLECLPLKKLFPVLWEFLIGRYTAASGLESSVLCYRVYIFLDLLSFPPLITPVMNLWVLLFTCLLSYYLKSSTMLTLYTSLLK